MRVLTRVRFIGRLAVALALLHVSTANALVLQLDSLPSAQGALYRSGVLSQGTAGPAEADVFRIDRGALSSDTTGTDAFAYYFFNDVIDSDRPFTLETRLRVADISGDGASGSFVVGINSTEFAFLLAFESDGEIRLGSRTAPAPRVAVNLFEEHVYRLDGQPDGTYNFSVDGALAASGSALALPFTSSGLIFGDSSSGGLADPITGQIIANTSRVLIYGLSVMQPVPEPPGLLLSLFGAGVFLLRASMRVPRS